jgi:xanthine dehydrogenase molybdenum-binding subunit
VALTERGGGGGQGAARVVIYRDGSARVFYASTDIGTGSKTTLAMIAAETLGIPLSSFQTVAGDTEAAPYEQGSMGNRVLQGTGRAVVQASRNALRQILEAARPLLDNVAADQLEMRDAVIRVKEQPGRSVSLRDVMQRRNVVTGEGYTVLPQTGTNVERTSGAHFVEVEVDKETGKFRVLRCLAAHDMGRAINLTIAENQIEGGTIQGLALALGEELRYDKRTGGCLATSIQELRHPTQLDVDARTIEALIVKNESVLGPYGAKGVGENPTHPGMAAVANAIYNAAGIRLREVPFSRSKVLAALSTVQGSARPTA